MKNNLKNSAARKSDGFLSFIKSLIADIKNIYNNLIARGHDEISVWQKDIDALQKLNDMMLDALSSIEQRNNNRQKAEKNTSDEVVYCCT